MSARIKTFVRNYRRVHLALGLFGNAAFFVGSIFFLPALDPWETLGVWLFIAGAFFMTVSALRSLLVDLWREK